ncbi:MAG TPA: TonB family protein [Terracidiphilus sp.]|nr:TonB family protein [Terracidiphilus sp.]
MDDLLEGGEQLERELAPESIVAPAAGSLLIHGALAALVVLYMVLGGFFHSSIWGTAGLGSAMQATLVSSALPLPADQLNQNVLATEAPSQAPALPSKTTRQLQDLKAIPIPGKQAKPKKETVRKTQPHQPKPQQNAAQYGEQAGSVMPRAIQSNSGSNGPTATSGDFGSLFPWYVDQINRKMSTTWYKQEVDPSTPKGARVYLVFTIDRGGRPSDVQMDRSSGSRSLDQSCMRGVQRVDTFGPLPSPYRQSTLRVSYYCEY